MTDALLSDPAIRMPRKLIDKAKSPIELCSPKRLYYQSPEQQIDIFIVYSSC